MITEMSSQPSKIQDVTFASHTLDFAKFGNFVYMSAPLEDNSDNAFRTLCHRHGADVTFTEMIRVKALAAGNKSTWSRLAVYDAVPTIVQLLVNNEKDLEKFLDMFKPFDGFCGFNINMGCPSPDVIGLGLGCAMIKRIAKTQKLIDVIRARGYGVSVKLRLGMNGFEKERKVYLNLISQTTADFYIVHLRHGGQKYAQPSDWSVLGELGELATVHGKNIIINGDIHTISQVDLVRAQQLAGVMLGRAAVYNPSIFCELKGGKSVAIDTLRAEYMQLAALYETPQRFSKNVLQRMGCDTKKLDANLLI
jgi:tRNA-dihydrouridine synthase B